MDRFVVGTGRCGSTLLSRMLAEHPALLSVFEFFNGLDMTKRFTNDVVDGEALAALISQEHPFVTMVLSRGYEVEEITYPFGRGARYKRDDRLPWLLVSTLPRLTDDPDALFDETVTYARTLPARDPPAQYRLLFEWLAQRLGRACWVERSGSSIDYLGQLHRAFPEARFLHIHRDGHETALSMREHAAYRLRSRCCSSSRAARSRRSMSSARWRRGGRRTRTIRSAVCWRRGRRRSTLAVTGRRS